ncbi:hypothetical protein K504DRAFT_367995 [Pleomassaria siparia CBS 279.74]|uniref:Uncharacterized protein n=1 Tax=Pleomassaria siparia CBS 279.74 TaxID=1314801 RepID=A0A6G1KS19_9PLEO|nr:hypothetical protein K504DRAFT_367995 [Pleomassaria siparia CBS 279.74]
MTPIVAGVISLVVMAVVGLLVFLCLRKRKQKQRQIQASQAKMQEMKARSLVSTNPVLGTSPTYTQSPMYTQSPTYAQYAAPLNSPRPANLATPPPVILGPIVPGSNGAYFTGIDTSDMVSMHDQQRPGPDRTGLGNPFADGDSLNEEPPPPYRPRSLAPMSRNTSVRTPRAASSQTYLIRGHDSARSPFADPRDDDVISEMSGPTLLRGNSYNDGMSVVSDMSYQETPVVARPSI